MAVCYLPLDCKRESLYPNQKLPSYSLELIHISLRLRDVYVSASLRLFNIVEQGFIKIYRKDLSAI